MLSERDDIFHRCLRRNQHFPGKIRPKRKKSTNRSTPVAVDPMVQIQFRDRFSGVPYPLYILSREEIFI